MTSHEKSGWRDEAISKRHRSWGNDCPMVDIDTLWVEYSRAIARAIVEYKHHSAGRQPINDAIRGFDPSSKAVSKLATAAAIPAFIVRYWPGEPWRFQVFPLNDFARALVGPTSVNLDELSWVRLLYQVRDELLPPHLEQRLSILGTKTAAAAPPSSQTRPRSSGEWGDGVPASSEQLGSGPWSGAPPR